MSVLEPSSPANSGVIVELPLDTYGCGAADNVKESIVATGVPYK
jgi:hypothetical protein